MSERLKPCPFCGEVPEFRRNLNSHETMTGSCWKYVIQCKTGDCLSVYAQSDNKRTITRTWNTRKEPTS